MDVAVETPTFELDQRPVLGQSGDLRDRHLEEPTGEEVGGVEGRREHEHQREQAERHQRDDDREGPGAARESLAGPRDRGPGRDHDYGLVVVVVVELVGAVVVAAPATPTVIVTVDPASIEVPAAGSTEITRPSLASPGGRALGSTLTSNPLPLRSAVASSSRWPLTAGTFAGSAPVET